MKFQLILIVLGLILLISFLESGAKIQRKKLTPKKLSATQRHKRLHKPLSKPKKAFKNGRSLKHGADHSKRKVIPNFVKAKNKRIGKSVPSKSLRQLNTSKRNQKKYSNKLNTVPKPIKPVIPKSGQYIQYTWIRTTTGCVRKKLMKSKHGHGRIYSSEHDCKISVGKFKRLRRRKSSQTNTYFYFNEKSRQCESKTGSSKGPNEFDTNDECEDKYAVEINSIDPINPIPPSIDPVKPVVNESEPLVYRWVRTKKRCIKYLLPKSKTIGRPQIFYTEGNCLETAPEETVYVYNSNEHACMQHSVRKVNDIHYRSLEECIDKNIAFYYKNEKKSCEKWKIETGKLKKFLNLEECFDHHLIKNVIKKSSDYYCYLNKECVPSNTWKRNCYESRRECLVFKGRQFFVFNAIKNTCVRTFDPTAHGSMDECKYANRAKLMKRKITPHYYNELRLKCVPVQEGKPIYGKQYDSFDDCIRDSPTNFRQASPEPHIPPRHDLTVQCEDDYNWYKKFFRCRNGRCIRIENKCDSRNDCGDNSDEDKCYYTTTTQPCSELHFPCVGSGKCIPVEKLCNGIPDCEDETDESLC